MHKMKSLKALKNFLHERVLYNYSFLLVYLSFITYFLKNNPELVRIVFSSASLVFLVVSFLIQVIFNYLLKGNKGFIIGVIYFSLLFFSFVFLNLNYLLNYLEQINVSSNGVLRVRYTSILLFFGFFLIAYVSSRKFQIATKVLNTFLITFIVSSIYFTNFSFISLNRKVVKSTKLNVDKNLNSIKYSGVKKKIILIVLDEYASSADISKYQSNKLLVSSFNNYLLTTGFSIIERNFTKETYTENSINQLFNYNSGLSFKDKSIEQVTVELREASVIKILESKGFRFKNYSFFNIGNHEEYYSISLFPKNDYEILLKNSMFFLFKSNLTFKNLANFGDFQIYADYNKMVFNESLDYINELKSDDNHFVYVHFFMPHHPFYYEKEFADMPITLENYVAFWNFSNKKIQSYLDSINNLSSYKIVITGDHGYRGDSRLKTNVTTSAFYNFDSTEVSQISNVQDIGKLLLIQ